jgi:hypothetical protein
MQRRSVGQPSLPPALSALRMPRPQGSALSCRPLSVWSWIFVIMRPQIRNTATDWMLHQVRGFDLNAAIHIIGL